MLINSGCFVALVQCDLEKHKLLHYISLQRHYEVHISPLGLWKTSFCITLALLHVSWICLCSNKCIGFVVVLSAWWHVTVTGMWTLSSSLAWVWSNAILFVFFLTSSDYAFWVYLSPSTISSFLAVFGFCTLLFIFIFSLLLFHVSLFFVPNSGVCYWDCVVYVIDELIVEYWRDVTGSRKLK